MLDCEEFIIENCDINTMDDGICLKGYTKNGCRGGIIRNNRVRSICNGIKMGTDSSGGFFDIISIYLDDVITSRFDDISIHSITPTPAISVNSNCSEIDID